MPSVITNYDGLRFALYARKSSEDEGSQANSIEDQLKYCRDFAIKNGINIVGEPFTEDKSARYAGRRKGFKRMLSEIKKGHYDAILAYHPDRLARNMSEGGLIADMLQPPNPKSDTPLLKTLAFPTMTFFNDSGGRLLLSIQFGLATNYSDHLSEQIKRGNDTNLTERGVANGTPKWGYNRNYVTGEYTPDENWPLIKHAWDILLAGGTQEQAIRYLIDNNVHRMSKITHKNKVVHPIYVSDKTKMFQDPFYYGELRQGPKKDDNPIWLKDKWPDFKEMVTKEQFLTVQKGIAMRRYNGSKTVYRIAKSGRREEKDFLPLKGLVMCGECGKMMCISQSKGRGGDRYVYCECRNKECSCYRKRARAHVIFDYIYDILSKIMPDDATFEQYEADLDEYINIELKNYSAEISSLRGELAGLVDKHNKAKKKYAAIAEQGDNAPKGVLEDVKAECEAAEIKVEEQKNLIAKVQEKIANPDLLKMTKDEFINLLKMASEIMMASSLIQKDTIVRILFANIVIDKEKRLSYLCNPEFKGLFRDGESQIGSTRWDRTTDLRLMSPAL